jgi:hypothetical protein
MITLAALFNWLYGVNLPTQLTAPKPTPEPRCYCGHERADHDNDGWCACGCCSYYEPLSGHWLTPVWPETSSSKQEEGVAA